MHSNERDTVLHSWCVQSEWRAPTVVGGAGARFRDEHGREFLDMSSLSECCNLGHQHPKVVAAIRDQAARLCFTTSAWGAQPRAELAQLLLEKAGFEGGRVFFTLGGADANEHALKFARQARGLPKGLVIARDRSYHGASYATMALSGDARTRRNSEPGAHHVAHVPPPYAYRCPFGAEGEDECGKRAASAVAARIDRAGTDAVAAVIMEPDAGTNGIVAPDTYWPALRELTRIRGIPLIADEVMSGFGRCGEWFAWQRHGEAGKPDLITLAKGLTGAHLPLGAVLLSAQIAQKLENEPLSTGLTYCGHPLCCAAGLAAVRAYEEENLIQRARELGEHMHRRLRVLQDKHESIGDVRGHGMFGVIELVADRGTREPLAPWPQLAPAINRLLLKALDQGVSFAARGNLILLAPPLVIERTDLASALELLDTLLTELETETRSESREMEAP
jgi:taurine--2-oxoglutarate transaminase